MWLLWDCLSAECQNKLVEYQRRRHRMVLQPPVSTQQLVTFQTEIEPLEEIERIMRQVPHSPRRVK